MPTKREREYYRMGFDDGIRGGRRGITVEEVLETKPRRKPKRKLSAWNKYVKANSNKPRFRLRSGKINLKKMGVAFRKTPAGKKKRR
jgi:hypothetical protein